MTRSGAAIRWTSAWFMSLAACASPLDAPSAYIGERFLCTPENAAEFQALSSMCRETYLLDGSCAGFASMKGQLGGQPFVVDGPLVDAFYVYDAAHPTTVSGVTARGSS